MSLVVLGTNHKSATLAVRERWTYGLNEIPMTLEKLKVKLKSNDVVLLSTCNRTEIYCDLENPNQLIDWYNKEVRPTTELDIEVDGYFYEDKQAISHIMRVAAGLDSLVVGEPQILGQFKQAYRLAQKANTIGKKFEKLFNQAILAAKTVRTYTDIGMQPVSVASASVNLLIKNRPKDNLDSLKILLLGSGDTIKTIGKTLLNKNISNITIASRSMLHSNDLALELGEYKNAVIKTTDFAVINNPEELLHYDVIFSATRSPVYILTYDVINQVNKIKCNDDKLLLIDLAVPRDIDPKCTTLDNIRLYTIDDLKSIIESSNSSRQSATVYAEKIINQQINEFYSWENSLLALSSICTYRQKAEAMCSDILEKSKRKLEAGQDPEEVLISALNTLRNKLLHHPTMTLKSLAQDQRLPEVELLKDFLNL